MKFELGLERPDANRAWISALTIGTSYFLGGIIPLSPYAFIPHSGDALVVSCIITIITLFVFGYMKSRMLGTSRPLYGGLQMMIVGALAAAGAFFIARLIPTDF